MRVYFNKNKVKQGEIICKWFIITHLRSCFTLFHYFTLKSKVWVAYPYLYWVMRGKGKSEN